MLLWFSEVVLLGHTFGMGFTFCAMYSSPQAWARMSWWRGLFGVLFWEILWGHGIYTGLFRSSE